MTNSSWEVACADPRTPKFTRLSSEGWEPFAVTPEDDASYVWFRRQQHEKRPVGRPPVGSTAAAVSTVRLPPELKDEVDKRIVPGSLSFSDIVREALWDWLEKS
jgi:hypothetical protein